jgi:AraC-like DNA-binding protein
MCPTKAASIHELMDALRFAPIEVILADADGVKVDIQRTGHQPWSTKFVLDLSRQLTRLPNDLALRCAAIGLGLLQARDVSELARRSHMSASSVRRRFHEAGLSMPQRFLAAAKLVRSLDLLNRRRQCDVAAETCFGAARSLARALRELGGTTVSELRRGQAIGEIVDRIAHNCRERKGA